MRTIQKSLIAAHVVIVVAFSIWLGFDLFQKVSTVHYWVDITLNVLVIGANAIAIRAILLSRKFK